MSAVLFLQTKPNIQYISNTKHQLSADNVKNIFGHKWITHTMYLKKQAEKLKSREMKEE